MSPTRYKEHNVIRTFSFSTIHSFSECRNSSVPTSAAASGMDGCEVLRLVDHFWQAGTEGLRKHRPFEAYRRGPQEAMGEK